MREPESRTALLRRIEKFLEEAQGVQYTITARTPGKVRLELEPEDAKSILVAAMFLLKDSLYHYHPSLAYASGAL